MKSLRQIVFSAALITLSFSTAALPDENDPSILSEFGNYKLTDVGAGKLDELYASLSGDLSVNGNGMCYERAHLWNYQLYKQNQIQSGKIFIFYAWYADPNKPYAYRDTQGWWFHVVPYVIADGKEYVLEKFQDIIKPMPFEEWEAKRTHGNKCIPLSAKDEHQRNRYFRTLTNPNYAMSFENDEGPCFIRRVPMYYKTTVSVAQQGMGQDLGYNQFNFADVFDSCFNTTSGRDKNRAKRCNAFIDSGKSSDIIGR